MGKIKGTSDALAVRNVEQKACTVINWLIFDLLLPVSYVWDHGTVDFLLSDQDFKPQDMYTNRFFVLGKCTSCNIDEVVYSRGGTIWNFVACIQCTVPDAWASVPHFTIKAIRVKGVMWYCRQIYQTKSTFYLKSESRFVNIGFKCVVKSFPKYLLSELM